MEKQIVIHPYSAISHGHNKELATDRCNRIDALQQHFAKLKKPDSKNYKLYDFMCIIYQKETPWRQKLHQWWPTAGGTRRLTSKGHKRIVGVMEMLHLLVM